MLTGSCLAGVPDAARSLPILVLQKAIVSVICSDLEKKRRQWTCEPSVETRQKKPQLNFLSETSKDDKCPLVSFFFVSFVCVLHFVAGRTCGVLRWSVLLLEGDLFQVLKGPCVAAGH